jgi:hypothetical protein
VQGMRTHLPGKGHQGEKTRSTSCIGEDND